MSAKNPKSGNPQRPEYTVWATMKRRCKNVKHPTFAKYGAKGITVCDRWEYFAQFLEDMGPRPNGYTLERIDSRGNYEPSNCRWATRIDQNNNRCCNRIVEFRGQKMALGAARRAAGCIVKFGTVTGRLRRGWDLERALTEPLIKGEDLRRRQSEGQVKSTLTRLANREVCAET